MEVITITVSDDATFIRPGDIFTIAGDYKLIRNPRRRWWTFWRPRFVALDELQTYVVR